MIKMLRVDHRLLHGQVAFTWSKFLDVDCILLASDNLVNDELRMQAMRMAKPTDIKLVMKSIDDSIKAINSGVTDKYKLFIITDNINSAYNIIKNTNIHQLTLGGTKATDTTKQISKAIHLDCNDEKQLAELKTAGVEITIQQVPSDNAEKY